MYSETVPLLLSAALVGTAALALFSRSVSSSLILLFYSSVFLGVIFAVYGDALVGLLHMITFAGAVSVLLLTVILMTGQSDLSMGLRRPMLLGTVSTLLVAASLAYLLFGGMSGQTAAASSDISMALFSFVWHYRPWDLLILVTVLASSMLVIVNLLSGDS